MAVAADIVVEDGTGLDTANSYVSIADADTYHELRGNASWTDATQDQKATALIHATEYLDMRWTFVGAVTFPGSPSDLAQALQWPRTDDEFIIDSRGNQYGDDEIPFWIVNATLEYALAYLTTGRLLPDPTVPDTAGRFVTLKREKLGPLEEETRFSDSRGTITSKRTYALADKIIRQSGLSVIGGDRSIRA